MNQKCLEVSGFVLSSWPLANGRTGLLILAVHVIFLVPHHPRWRKDSREARPPFEMLLYDTEQFPLRISHAGSGRMVAGCWHGRYGKWVSCVRDSSSCRWVSAMRRWCASAI